jgi:putative restriction endonuclease
LKTFVGVTDKNWFTFLSSIPEIDEVNFWQPGGKTHFRALNTGQPFLFKLHSPLNYIVGGGFFAHSTILPISLAWQAFGEKNGARSLNDMRQRLEKYRRISSPTKEDYPIGCILLEQPFFFDRSEWIPVPSDWKLNIVRGKTYDLTIGLGAELWDAVQHRLQRKNIEFDSNLEITEKQTLYGKPTVIIPRLGQGSFRIVVTDAYNRRCAVTQERTLPALEAAHIKPFSDSGPHRVDNGLLLRSDIHKLFDNGYVTITNDHRFEVSRRIKEEYENGRDYYAMHGRNLFIPQNQELKPSYEFITWHNENVYRG